MKAGALSTSRWCIHGNHDDEDCIPCELGYFVSPPPGYRVLRAELLREPTHRVDEAKRQGTDGKDGEG